MSLYFPQIAELRLYMDMATYLCQIAQAILENEVDERNTKLNAQISVVLGMEEVLDDLYRVVSPSEAQLSEIETLEMRIPQEKDKLSTMKLNFDHELSNMGQEVKQFLSQR